MGVRVEIKDSSLSGNVLSLLELQLPSAQTTAREIIEMRVRKEVAAWNSAQESGAFRGLVQPTEAEALLNGARKRLVDADAQCRKALEAFLSNGFFLLVDDRQVTDPDEELVVSPITCIQFVRLVPLVGG